MESKNIKKSRNNKVGITNDYIGQDEKIDTGI